MAPAPRVLLLLLLLPPPGAQGDVCLLNTGDSLSPKACPQFCCGTCDRQYCCPDVLKRAVWSQGCDHRLDSIQKHLEEAAALLEKSDSLLSDVDTDPMPGFGATIAIGLTIFVLFIVTIIVCFTCSCCCLYKMCCRPRPVVTTTTATTVVHAPYPQPPAVPPSYPGPSYQGYHPIPPQPGMVAAPYPAHPVGPPAYHETLAGDAAMAYPASQPPYNPAYMDPPKATR
ncbi:protein shisa-5 isoform X2 [Pipistrellus kuhlii]|uniref:protein shisa-5 isoform X2 n=1 Tax=Pipistrellus kuhlii TaxID=59472 RepID=UPI001E271122|nr:protein shisa-5 isoform X2 [Pipistrellus kuhlii]